MSKDDARVANSIVLSCWGCPNIDKCNKPYRCRQNNKIIEDVHTIDDDCPLSTIEEFHEVNKTILEVIDSHENIIEHLNEPSTAGDSVIQTDGDNATQRAGDWAMQKAGDCSTQMAGDSSIQTAGDEAIQTAGDWAIQKAGNYSTQTAGNFSTQTAGDFSTHIIFGDTSYIIKKGQNCVLIQYDGKKEYTYVLDELLKDCKVGEKVKISRGKIVKP